MPEFGVVLEIDVFQRSAKMLALLHGLPDPVREMEVFQPMNIGGEAILQCFACKGGGEGVIGDSHADISTAKLFRKLVDPGRQDVCKPAQQIDLFAGMQRPERLGLA